MITGGTCVKNGKSIDNKLDQLDHLLEEMGVRIKDADQLKVREDVFDEVTLLALYKLVHKKWLSAIGGSISTGKEANVFYGERDGGGIAIKIYRIRTANFTTMSWYITGDRRFSHVKKAKKELDLCLDKKGVFQPCPGSGSRSCRSRTPRLGPEYSHHVVSGRG